MAKDKKLPYDERFQLFNDEDAAREVLEQKRWPNGTICPATPIVSPRTSRPGANQRFS